MGFLGHRSLDVQNTFGKAEGSRMCPRHQIVQTNGLVVANVTCCLSTACCPLLLWPVSPSSLLSVTPHVALWETSDKLPVVRQASATAGCFCIVCVKLLLVFL